jgi:hypothetical protein
MDTQLINEIKNDILALQAKLDEIIQRNSNDAIRLGPTEDGKVKVMAEHDFDIALTMYADHITRNYNRFSPPKDYPEAKFNVSFERGRKFIKITTASYGSSCSVHSFICIKPHDQWQFGDILKAATWSQPAKNYARGNVLDPKSYAHHSWTGA